MNYYNEHDQKAAEWIRELIAARLIPAGHVDTRSIIDVSPDDLAGYTQCHFFAGIAGWSLALELAEWPATRPVWTGSCPCQPFSSAGKGKGASDDRHLWPVFRRLIAKLRPERVFGEQVAQAIGFNWLDGVSSDLEADGYAVGAAVLGAHSVGAPHIRQRLFWVANANSGRCEQRDASIGPVPIAATNGATGGMGDTKQPGLEGLAGNGNGGNQPGRIKADTARHAATTSALVRMGDTNCTGRDQRRITSKGARHRNPSEPTGFWDHYAVVHCRDGKARRFEPGSFPLADGVPGRVGLLRGYGNAIVPQAAALFIRASE